MPKNEQPETMVAEMMFSTDELEQVVSEWLANRVGAGLPVARRAKWLWSPGKGPVLDLHIESLPNVFRLPVKKKVEG